MKITTIGLDLASLLAHVICMKKTGPSRIHTPGKQYSYDHSSICVSNEGLMMRSRQMVPFVRKNRSTTSQGEDATNQGDGTRIAVLKGGGLLPWIMVNAVIERFGLITVIEEDKEPTAILVRRRMKMLGPVSTIGQIAFGVILKLLHKMGAGRKQKIMSANDLNPMPCENCTLIKVRTVNTEACRNALRQAAPDVVLVIGTRMIREETLSCIDAPFINYHAGISPVYRGMNGGYWALVHADHVNAGVTVHMVDKGVDTGDIIYTAPFKAKLGDNFVTYPLLQAAAGKPLVIKAVEDALNGKLRASKSDLPSKQWFHPTLWLYFWKGLTRGVW